MSRTRIICLISIVIAALPATLFADERADFFEKKIRPVLAEHCYECHAADSDPIRSGLRVDTRKTIREGGDSGEAVVPGDSESSLLLTALKYVEDDLQMPPSGRLPDSVIEDFELWIDDGAFDPREEIETKPRTPSKAAANMKTNAAASSGSKNAAGQPDAHWAFQPFGKPPIPTAKNSDWPRNNIDRFVLHELEKRQLPPVADADNLTLLRRLTFDLLGLPPTPTQISRFENAVRRKDIEDLVDECLASPRYGERWGRHWLDVARFAESTGGGRTKILDNAWRYRDYVIRTFNTDKPFNQFVREQIAGDLLPADTSARKSDQLTGTGFLALGPTNYELQDKDLLRMEVVDEQLDTIGRAFMGLTIGCARCHDHKFDPIPTRDYYALAGIMRSTQTLTPGNVSGIVTRELPVDTKTRKLLNAKKKKLKRLQVDLKQTTAELTQLTTHTALPVELPATARLVDNVAAKKTGTWLPSMSSAGFLGDNYEYAKSPYTDCVAQYSAELKLNEPHEVLVSYTLSSNRTRHAIFTVHTADGPQVVHVDQTKRPRFGAFVSLGTFRFNDRTKAKVSLVGFQNDTLGTVLIADAVLFLPVSTPWKSLAAKAQTAEITAQRNALEKKKRALQKELEQVQKTGPQAATILSVQDEKEPGDWHIHVRGNIRKLGDVVPRGFLSAVKWSPNVARVPSGSSGRLELANWVAADQNPLTARVIVNRVWQHLFGRGLVATPDNFGVMGQAPSHRELLDHLASEFVADGWSIRRLIRRIVLSRTYQLQSAEPQTNDPDNVWLSRQNRRRLDAECLRDAVLACSNQLDFSPAEFSVADGTRSEFGYQFRSRHRSVFVPVFRNTLHPFLEAFDFPNPNLVMGQRNVSTLPAQALYLMNSPFVIEQSQLAARQLLQELPHKNVTDKHFQLAFLRTLGRAATDVERKAIFKPLVDSDGDVEARLSRLFHTLFCSLEFRYVR